MAASSSDDSCAAPTDFDISSSIDDSNGRFSISTEKCPLCSRSKRAYYCKNCIRNGEFVRSTALRFPESFSEKKARLCKLMETKLLALDQINTAFSERVKLENLKLEIAACQERIRLLKLVLKDNQNAASEASTAVERGAIDIETRRRNIPICLDRVQSMQYEKEKLVVGIRHRRDQYEKTQAELQRVIRENADHLVKYIFPVVRVKPDDRSGDSLNNEDTVSALAEASRTAYVRGRWVYSDNSQDCKYQIVEALMPIAQHRDSVPGSSTELGHRNAGSAISAGLTCACQLVSILAFFLDIWLPKKLCYSEFCGQELNEQEFAYKVAKLNANILHLCLSQTVDPDRLHPRHTIANLLLLLDPGTCHLGWHGAYEINPDLMKCMEESLLQDLDAPGVIDDEDSELQEELDLFSDWETVAAAQILESPSLPSRVTVSAMPSPDVQPRTRPNLQSGNTAMSVTGGLVSAAASVASWWRAAIGHK